MPETDPDIAQEDRSQSTSPAAARNAAAVSLEEIVALVPCETPGRAEQEEIIARIGALRPAGTTRLMFGDKEVVVSSWRRGWQDYIRALHELAPEPAPDQSGRVSPKRYCRAGARKIAAHMGRGVSAVLEALDWLEDEGIITCVRPGDSTWPAAAGKQGCLRAPTWGVLAALVSQAHPQLRFPMHGTRQALCSPERFDDDEALCSPERLGGDSRYVEARASRKRSGEQSAFVEKALSLGGEGGRRRNIIQSLLLPRPNGWQANASRLGKPNASLLPRRWEITLTGIRRPRSRSAQRRGSSRAVPIATRNTPPCDAWWNTA